MVSIVVAYSKNRVIGKNNDIPWYLPADLKHFKEITLGKTVIMGSNTYKSIFKRLGHSLPGRRNIVLSKKVNFSAPGAEVINSLEIFLKENSNKDLYIIGGGEIFKLALPYTDKIYATEIEVDIEGDVFFPPLVSEEWIQIDIYVHKPDIENIYNYSFVTYEKISNVNA